MIKLFSEKVNPTFTNSAHNILTVESFEEVFFDVFEFEINGTKYIAEKQSEYKGYPVVAIPVVVESVEQDILFVLTEGEFNVILNLESINSDIDSDIFLGDEDNRLSLQQEIQDARLLAEEHAKRIEIKKISEIAKSVEEREQNILEAISNIKGDIVDDFNSYIIQNRSDLETFNEQKNSALEESLLSKIEDNFSLFLEQNNNRIDHITNILNEKVSSIVDSVVVDKIDPALLDVIDKNKEYFKVIEEALSVSNSKFAESLRDELEQVERVLVEQNVELNSKIKRGVDKALSRIGNIKTTVDSTVNDLEKRFTEDLELATENIKRYYDGELNKIKLLEESNKDELIKIIEDSRNSLLKKVSKDGEEIQYQIVQEKYDPKKGSKEFNKEVKKLKTDLEKSINNRFTQEMTTVRRILELGSGGGSVAMQFADGGTMRGDLTILGCQYIKSKSFDDYSQECIFRDELVFGENTTATFPIRTDPALSTAKFHATYIGTNGGRSFVEVWVGVANMNCYINSYSVINTDNSNPVLNTLSCNLNGNVLNIVSNVNDESSVVLSGKATYVNNTVELLFGQENQDWFFDTEQEPETFFELEQ